MTISRSNRDRTTIILLVIAIIAAIVALAVATGCGNTPTHRWAEARIALTSAQDTLVTLNTVGIVSDEEYRDVGTKVVLPAREALAVAEAQLPAGGDTFDDWMAVVQAALDSLARSERARAAIATEAARAPPDGS